MKEMRILLRGFWGAGLAIWTCCAVSAMGLELNANMVLNRSFFLSWTEASAGDAGFGGYEVYAGPVAEGLGVAPAAVFSKPEECYVTLRGLAPETEYVAKVRQLDANGGEGFWSEEVRVTTLKDGITAATARAAGAKAAAVRVPAFMYHHVMPRANFPAGYDAGGWYSTENFERDLAYMKQYGIHTVTTEEILSGNLPENPVFLTFDDGYVDFLTYAVPLLTKYGFQAVNAIVTQRTGGQSTWAVPEWPLGTLMTWAQIRQCVQKGMPMGGHTQTHVNLYAEPNKMYEVAGSYNDIVRNLGTPVYFCYPWGMGGHDYAPGKTAVKNAGYKLATRTYPAGLGSTASDLFFFPRQFADQTDALRNFLVKGDFDTDHDGLKNYRELDWSLNAGAPDTDGDRLTDYEEVAYDGNAAAYNPYHPTSNPNGVDLCATRTDTDLDGLSDYAEVKTYGSNPLKADTDGDGLSDGAEANTHRTSPTRPDTDGDGMDDKMEITKGTNPLVKNGRLPFTGTAYALPGTIPAENFDYGGAEVAYADTTPGNAGGMWRPFENVDIAKDTTASTGYSVGWNPSGEWLSYSVSVATSNQFTVTLRLAASGTGGKFHVEIDGVNVTGTLTVPSTGSWVAWREVESGSFALSAGRHVVKLVLDTAGSSGNVAALDRLTFRAAPVPVAAGPYGGTAWAVPGTVQIENYDVGASLISHCDTTATNLGKIYRPTEPVDICAGGSGYVVGWTPAGEWMNYSLNVASSGTYVLEMRAAASGTGGKMKVQMDGADWSGELTVPDTKSWNTFQTLVRSNLQLTAGAHTARVAMVTAGSGGNAAALDWFALRPQAAAPAPTPSAPYGGTAWPIPGTVEFENFNTGGEGVAYHDTTAGNAGNQYRTTENVDISADAGAGNGHVVGWTPAGEWMEYTVNVASAGTYRLEAHVAGVGSGGKFRFLVNGVVRGGTLSVPHTGSWSRYQAVKTDAVAFSSGIQTVRVELVTAGSSGNVAALDRFVVSATTTSAPPTSAQAPYGGTPWALPGTVQIENFDRGGEGVAYHDTTAGNAGNQYRTTEDVDIALVSASNYSIGWTPAGEWMEYTVCAASSGVYQVALAVAGVGTGGQVRMLLDGADVSGVLNVPDTGSWSTFRELSIADVAFSGNIQTVRVELVSAGTSGNVAALDRFSVSSTMSDTRPYSGTPHVLPGVVEIEDFDEGGEGKAYHDTTTGNAGKQYRPNDSVDIAADSHALNGYSVGWDPGGEWMDYTVNVTAPGRYTVAFRLAASGSGGQFHLRIDGRPVATLAVPDTGSWSTFSTVSANVSFTNAGVHTVRLLMLQATASSTYVAAFDRMSWSMASSSSAARASRVAPAVDIVEAPSPVDVLSSVDDECPASGWLAVDGDPATAWTGSLAEGCWIVLAYARDISPVSIDVTAPELTLAKARLLASADADTWMDWTEASTNELVPVRYLWLLFPPAAMGNPQINEIVVWESTDSAP